MPRRRAPAHKVLLLRVDISSLPPCYQIDFFLFLVRMSFRYLAGVAGGTAETRRREETLAFSSRHPVTPTCNEEMTNRRRRMGSRTRNQPSPPPPSGGKTACTFEMLPSSSSDVASHASRPLQLCVCFTVRTYTHATHKHASMNEAEFRVHATRTMTLSWRAPHTSPRQQQGDVLLFFPELKELRLHARLGGSLETHLQMSHLVMHTV